MNLRVEAAEFDPGIRRRELPVDTHLAVVSLVLPCADFALEVHHRFDPSIDALLGHGCEFAFRDVEPTTMLGRVVQLQSGCETMCLLRIERFVQRTDCMRVEVVAHQSDDSGIWVVDVEPDRKADNAGVDDMLVDLAMQLGGKVVTNDYNLNKVAQLRGVTVININDLANALKPVVLPGESLEIKVIKPGEEVGQGIGYLDDGTMVVAEGARDRIGQTVGITITSVLQTSAGRMIFGRLDGVPAPERRRARAERA